MNMLTTGDLEAGLEYVRAAPHDVGKVEMIVARPAGDERLIVDEAELSREEGLIGDDWRTRMPGDDPPDLETQLTLMNARYTDLIAGDRERWQLAGDQLYVDFDLSVDHLQPGTRLRIGTAVIEISQQPHTGCSKFTARFGLDALRMANSEVGRQLRLRGVYASVVEPGRIRNGDTIERLANA